MDRRTFNRMAAMAGAAAGSKGIAAVPAPESFVLRRNGWMPNNRRLPVVVYRGAFDPSTKDLAAEMERVFERNGWPAQWRDGVYNFHHYHSTTHEVLGFAGGGALLMLGGENGREVTVRAGDVAVLPTGTGHRRISASGDFLVIGAYPPGAQWDICRSAPDEVAVKRMAAMGWPQSDPVHGAEGPLLRLWKSA
ncbi:MAG TPA: cupin [Terracidiphilus sp.]|jgi:uncharacterized protein YjlB